VLVHASEIFLVSTTRDVQAVGRCDNRALDAPGPLTREAIKAWTEHEQRDLDP